MIDKILSLLVLICLGYICKKYRIIDDRTALSLRSLVFNITLPALIFLSIRQAPWNVQYLHIPLIMWLSALFLGVMVYFISSKITKNTNLAAIILLTGVMGNTTFLGYPLVSSLLGESKLPFGIVYDQASVLFLLIILVPFITYLTNKQSKLFNKKSIIYSFLKNPPLWAIVLAIFFNDVIMPSLILDTLSIISESTTFLVMIYVGSVLNLNIKIKEIAVIVVIIIFKQILFPAINYLISDLMNVSWEIKQAVLIQASMPVMIATIVYGGQLGLDITFISKIVTISTIISPIFLYIISSFIF